MQVTLCVLPEAGMSLGRKSSGLLPFAGDSPDSLSQNDPDELRDRVKRDDQRDAQAAATLVPTRSSDVISDSERNVDVSSRTFRRQAARDGATEQFRQDRQAFRQALSDAREQRTDSGRQRQTVEVPRPEAKRDAKTNTSADATPGSKPTKSSGGEAAKAATTMGSPRAPVEKADVTAATARVASTGGAAVAAGTALTRGAAGTQGSPATQAPAAVGRVSASAASRGARAGGIGGAKAGVITVPGASATRGSTRGASSAGAKAGDTRAAESADREANIERIVRVIRSRINGERSHTVMRVDPPELGSLRLQMDLRGSALTLRIEPTTELAHQLLSGDMSKLRDGLEAAGIQLERVEVRPPTPAPEAAQHDPSQQFDAPDDSSGGSAHTDAEHPNEQGKDSHLTPPVEPTGREDDPEPATESLVNVVA